MRRGQLDDHKASHGVPEEKLQNKQENWNVTPGISKSLLSLQSQEYFGKISVRVGWHGKLSARSRCTESIKICRAYR